ncbi:hypothetical protein FRB99_004117 [Tulasnella sp. 403]|nr:hypothetical protein FRB99_004117 [Tulasnella sp. 403]
MPTPTESAGGFFTLYRMVPRWATTQWLLEHASTFQCSQRSDGAELRDILIVDDALWCLWDLHGQAVVGWISLDLQDDSPSGVWNEVTLPEEPDYSPEYFDELLQRNGSLTEAFMSCILRPGMFSRNTLTIAVKQYCESLASVPGQHNKVLTTSYPTLSEKIAAVVGSTVDLMVDPRTGEQLWDQYWSTLKRDWEGFVARCKEIERSARWPVSLGVGESGRIVVLERERLGVVAVDDSPLQLYKVITSQATPQSTPTSAQTVLETAWTLYSNIKSSERQGIESQLVEVTRESVVFSYHDIGVDLSTRLLQPQLTQHLQNWVLERVRSAGNAAQGMYDALRLVLDLEKDIKPEAMDEDAAGLNGRAIPKSERWADEFWPKAFTTSYVSATVHARYELYENELMDDEDRDALSAVLPLQDRHLVVYYQHVVALFQERSLDGHVITFAKLAIGAHPVPEMTAELWDTVFKAYLTLGLYEEAYMTMVSVPHTDLQQNLIRELVNTMCDKGEMDRLTRLNFVGYQVEVERHLAFKARNADPLAWPNYAKVLYAWYVFRGDYRNAGQAMFRQARRLQEVPCHPDDYIDIATGQAQCYLAAINCLSLVDPKNAWVAMPASSQALTRKRAITSSVIPEEVFTDGGGEVEIVEIADMRQEYMLVLSRLALAQRYPQHDVAHFVIGPADIVSRYVQEGAFDDAIASARSLRVSMVPLFENLVVRTDDVAPWLMTDRVQAWGGTLAQRAWRYLQDTLERNDSAETDYEYRKVVLKKIMEEDRTVRLPTWLVQFFEENQPEHLIRTCYRYDLIEDALRYSIHLVKETQKKARSLSRATREPLKTAFATWLPYMVFDQVLVVAAQEGAKKVKLKGLAEELKKELTTWMAYAKMITAEIRTSST